MRHEFLHPVLRTIVLWCPDWPVIAAMHERGLPAESPVALVRNGNVFAVSSVARSHGVTRGLRLREAQSRCPQLRVFPYDADLDLRAFEPVLTAIEEVMPGVQLLRPGVCAIRSHGPSRFYGSDEEAALWLLDTVDALGFPDARVGIADGPFTAEYAARGTTRPRVKIVEEGGAAAFLRPLPVRLLGESPLTSLLQRLGIHTLGDFAALSPHDVLGRFGQEGAHLHALAGGSDSSRIIPRTPPRELDSVVSFEPPLDRIDQVAFGFRAAADRFIETITAARLVCTSIRVEIDSDAGETSERTWLHPRSFTSPDVIDRIRWQLQGDNSGSGVSSPVVYVRVVPESVDAIGNHEEGLWGTAADERIHHGLARVQSLLGHSEVVTAVIGGGRTIGDRRTLVAFGDRHANASTRPAPWAGQLPAPVPTTVFETRRPVTVLAADGTVVSIDERGTLSGAPKSFSTGGEFGELAAWAGPWPVDERWWARATAGSTVREPQRSDRFQLVDGAGMAWLVVLERGRWWAEARYD